MEELAGCKRGLLHPASPSKKLIVSTSRTGVSLDGVLASKNRLRFTQYGNYSIKVLNDVLAVILLNDVLAVDI